MPLLPRDPGGQGGGIEEAPLDGKLYGRRMARWDEVPKLLTLIYYRGPFATPDELRAAYPTDIPGAYAVVSSTSSIWIWNHDKWEDTGATQTQAGILDAPHDGQTYGRKDGDWVVVGTGTINEEEVILIIKNTQHNVLKGIQGGKVENGQVTEAYHLTREEWEKLPVRPSVISPANGETNINQVPQIVGTPYAHPYDTGMYQKHIQIATTNDFAAPIYEKVEFSGTPVFQVPLKPDNSPYLTQDTVYYVRIRYQDRKGRWSHWSAPSTFRTMVQFPAGILLTPVMLAPVDGGQVQPVNPVLAMSAPKTAAGFANFDKADWQISADSTFATTVYDKAGSDDLTMHTTEGLNLTTTLGVDFFARGRQRTTDGTYTPWAIPVRFGLRPEYSDPIFGLRRIFSKKHNCPFVYNIDPEGNIVHISERYWRAHPLYAFVKQTVVVGKNGQGENVESEMVFVPPCWMKHRVYDNDDGDMVIDLWFSATMQTSDGWRLDPAFTGTPNGFLLARHVAISASIVPEGKTVLISKQKNYQNTIADRFNNLRNIDPSWHLWTIYERRLFRDLMSARYLATSPSEAMKTDSGTNILSPKVETGLTSPNYIAVEGISWVSDSNAFSSISVSPPAMQGGLLYSINLPNSVSGAHVTDILRGADPILGFDIALLGIPSAVATGEPGDPFGMGSVRIKKKMEDISNNFPIPGFSADDRALFGFVPCMGASRWDTVGVLTKWLD